MKAARAGDEQRLGRADGHSRIRSIAVDRFDLRLSLQCGQVFHWVPEGDGYLGMIGEAPVYVRQVGGLLHCSAGDEALIHRYFALDHPLESICTSFPKDDAMNAAAAFCEGMRIIRQPLWECVATFITSSMKQVTHIAQISHTLRERYGEARTLRGRKLYAYPSAAEFAKLEETDLRACSLGYRAKTLLAAAKMVAAGEVDLDGISTMDDEAARKELCRLPGVGEKVANCVLLFAYERLAAFPIDVWIERVLVEIYFKGRRNVTAKRLRDFSHDYFGSYGGYAQQYLFHHARHAWPKKAKAPGKARSAVASKHVCEESGKE